MIRRIRLLAAALLVALSVCACASLSEHRQQEYGMLMSAISFSAGTVFGEYGDALPENFDAASFLAVVQGRIPPDYFAVLSSYRLEVIPKGTYYRLLVFNEDAVALFDFSCTEQVDGPVLLKPGAYDLGNVDQYDPCRIPGPSAR